MTLKNVMFLFSKQVKIIDRIRFTYKYLQEKE